MKAVHAILASVALAAALAAAPARGQDMTSELGGGDAVNEAAQVAELEAAMMAGDYDKALAGAKTLFETSVDDTVKKDALRIMADACRKKGEFRVATAAYARLKSQFPKDSDEAIRCEAIHEILMASPDGIYKPLEKKAPTPEGETPKTLADDDCLDRSLCVLAEQRGVRLETMARGLRRGRTPQDVVKIFGPMANAYRQNRLLSPNVSTTAERESAQIAGERLDAIAQKVMPALRQQLAQYQPKMARPWSFTNVEKQAITNANTMLRDMATAEGDFQRQLDGVGGSGWDAAATLKQASADRANAYTQLAEEFVVPPYSVDYGW